MMNNQKSRSQRFKRQNIIGSILFLIFLLLLAACGPAPVDTSNFGPVASSGLETENNSADAAYPSDAAYPPAETEVSVVEQAYPGGESQPLVQPNPTSTPSTYPPPEEVFLEPRFRFDLPLEPGATIVAGQAPPNLALAILDITYSGVVLGTGNSDADGRFEISVKELTPGNRIGITFAELQPGKTLSDMSYDYYPYRGENFMNVPNVGIFFETGLVEE